MLEKKSPSNRYRKIECRMWGDEKFCSLSPMLPSGQALWIYLLTGPHTIQIPGLFRVGKAAMSENLDWPLEAFEEAFGEVFREGIAKACWKAKVVWVKNAIFYNKPVSSNVVLSWSTEWDLIPECELKLEAYEFLESAMGEFGGHYLDAFRKACRKPSGKPSGKTSPNQQQQQQQQQHSSQILLSNACVVGRQIVESNIEEGYFPLVVDTLTGEVIETGTLEIGIPRIEEKQPRIQVVQNDPNGQLEVVQSCPKVVQKDKKDKKDKKVKNGQGSLHFERFWTAYPWKQKKKYSQEIWERKKLDNIIDIILEDLAQRTGWASGNEFPPLPSTYLNGDLWNDEHKNRIRESKPPTKSLFSTLEEKYKLEEELKNKTEETNEN